MKKGDKVICIDDVFKLNSNIPKAYENLTHPKLNQIYTIRSVIKTEYGTGIRLIEIINPKIKHDKGGTKEPIYMTNRFKITRSVLCEKTSE